MLLLFYHETLKILPVLLNYSREFLSDKSRRHAYHRSELPLDNLQLLIKDYKNIFKMIYLLNRVCFILNHNQEYIVFYLH